MYASATMGKVASLVTVTVLVGRYSKDPLKAAPTTLRHDGRCVFGHWNERPPRFSPLLER